MEQKVKKRVKMYFKSQRVMATKNNNDEIAVQLGKVDNMGNDAIGLFKMFSRWIFHIFTAQIQSQ